MSSTNRSEARERHVIRHIGLEKYEYLITLLDYEAKITKYLQLMQLPFFTNKKVLIDTALCSGVNQYRFIKAKLNKDRTIDHSSLAYTNVDAHIERTANNMLKSQSIHVRQSVLTNRQKTLIEGVENVFP